MVRAYTNRSYGVVHDIVGDALPQQEVFSLLNQPQQYVFIDDNENICCICMVISPTKYDIHLHRKNRVKGKDLLQFMSDVKDYMFSETTCTALINFAPAENRAMVLMMGVFGSERITKLIGTAIDGGDEVMYVYSKYKEK